MGHPNPNTDLIKHDCDSSGSETAPGKDDSSAAENRNKSVKWQVGERCLALYSEDGVEYPAVVRAVKEWKETCVVEFDGYGNEEEVGWGDMRKKKEESKVRLGKKRKM